MNLLVRILKVVLKGFITTIIFFAVVEAGLRGAYAVRNAMVRRVPLPYSVGDEYGPIPPWLDRLLILVPDDTLIWRSLPNVHRTYVDIFSPVHSEQDRTALLRRFVPTLPAEFRDNPTWTIALNSEGYRSPEFSTTKAPSTVRIACVGDSWTFGMNVDQDRTYPSRLAAVLHEQQPETTFELLNFGVLGYSSFQGRQLLKARVIDLHPDIVAIGFGMNDSEVAGYRDKDMIAAAPPPPRLTAHVRDVAEDLEFYKLLKYFVLTMKFHRKPIGDYLKEESGTRGSGTVNYDEIEPWTRVSPQDYERNIREMIRLARERGARVILLDNELWPESPYRPVLKAIAADLQAPLVDSLKLIADAATNMARDLEVRLGLTRAERAGGAEPVGSAQDGQAAPRQGPPARRLTEVVFRVSNGSFPVATAMSIVGVDAQLGSLVPNAVAMHDDGVRGDERAGDGVWSLAAAFAPGTRISYVYTNSGARGRWEGLDLPHIRSIVVPSSADGGPVYLPIETFGRVYMQADDWHTDAAGYDLIAHAVADAIPAAR
jgi:lysophospholipase L1-like esterase